MADSPLDNEKNVLLNEIGSTPQTMLPELRTNTVALAPKTTRQSEYKGDD